MKDKINYIEAIKLYFNNTKHQISWLRYNDGRYGRRQSLLVLVPRESTAKQRRNRIILSYILFLIFTILTIIMSLINILCIIFGLILIGIVITELLTTLNFSFIKILNFKNLYNDNSNSYKILLKELYHENSLEKVLDIKSQYNGFKIVDYSPNYTLKEKRYYIQKNKNGVNVSLNRNGIIIKNINNDLEVIINDSNYNLEELKKVLLEQINNSLITEPKNYKWVYVGNITKKQPFEAYGIKLKFKRLYNVKKELCVTEKSLPNVKTARRYMFNIGFKNYYILLAKLDDNNYAIFEKHEC